MIGPDNIGVIDANETSDGYWALTCDTYRVCAKNVVAKVLDDNSTTSIQLLPVSTIIK